MNSSSMSSTRAPDEVHPLLDEVRYDFQHPQFSRSLTYHMSYVISKSVTHSFNQGQLEQMFPIWRVNVTEFPPRTPSIIRLGMIAVHDIYKGVSGQDASFLVTFLLRCFLVAAVEPGREILTSSVWELAKLGPSIDLDRHLESKFIRIEDLPDCTILHVRLPDRAARFIAESHFYVLQLDPHVTPFEINKRYGGVSATQISSGTDDPSVDAAMEKEKNNRLKHKIKRWLNKYFWWLSINEDANQFYPPYAHYNSKADEPPCSFYGVKRIGRLFARYDSHDQPVQKDGPFTREENRMYSLFKDVDRHRLLVLALNEVISPSALVKLGVLHSWFPLHNEEALFQLRKHWANYKLAFVFDQPINEIRNYFGEEIAMYFAFLMQYVHALKAPAIFGLLLFILSVSVNDTKAYATTWLNYLQLAYCIFIMIWVTHFNQKWNRFESRQRAVWGMGQLGSLRAVNPTDPLDQNFEYKETPENRNKRIEHREQLSEFRTNTFFVKPYPWTQQLARAAVSCTITLIATFLAVLFLNSDVTDYLLTAMGTTKQDNIYRYVYGWMLKLGSRFHWDETVVRERTAGVFITLTSIIIKILDAGSSKLVVPLTKFENHPTLSAYKDWASVKFFLFKFCIHFCPLLYLAFFKSSFDPCDDSPNGRCVFDLRQQLVTLFTVDVVTRLFKTFIKLHVTSKAKTICSKEGHRLSKQEASKPPYDGIRGIIGDYQEITTNVGLVALFSMVFPILPLLALLVTLIEIRGDAIKLCTLHQRPFPSSAGMIQTWQDAMKAMAFATIITNGYMAAFETVGYQWPETIKLFILMCIVVIGMGGKELVHILYPNEGKKEGLLRGRMNEVLHDAIVGPRVDASGKSPPSSSPSGRPVVPGVGGEFPHLPSFEAPPNKNDHDGVEMTRL